MRLNEVVGCANHLRWAIHDFLPLNVLIFLAKIATCHVACQPLAICINAMSVSVKLMTSCAYAHPELVGDHDQDRCENWCGSLRSPAPYVVRRLDFAAAG